jgi:hypothetical protein
MDILFENSKNEYPNSVTEPLRLEEKMFVQGVINNNLFKKREKVYVQNSNNIVTEYYLLLGNGSVNTA